VDRVRFHLLGPMAVTVDGIPVPLRGAAERALLALLLLSPSRAVPASSLIDRLWSESALPADPLNALQLRVSKLRRALAPAAVAITRERVGYCVEVDPASVDLEEFTQRIRQARADAAQAADRYTDKHLAAYDDALALWRGDPLIDFQTEPWASAAAARLTELRLAALTERGQIALALGRHRDVAETLEPIVAADPTLEPLAALLMVALYRSGRQADALDVYTRTRDELDAALGLEPSVSLRSLHQRILRQDPTLDPVPAAETAPVRLLGRGTRAEDRAEPTTNLPSAIRPLIGRDAELHSLPMLLGTSRLVTLIGPGGAGKTTLAVATAVRAATGFPDGAMIARLAPVTDPAQVPVAVAEAISVPLDGAAADRDVADRLAGYLAHRQMLLLLDNCEHVIDAAAVLADGLLGRCPGLTVLATSREALAVPDEVQVLVGPLATAPNDIPPGRIGDFPATRLFLDRARARRPDLQIDEPDLLAIGRICRALDGIPLAIELAAARVAVMSPVDIADRLGDRFSLLTAGPRTAEARQQTLRATVDWSYALLTEREKLVFDRLSVFHGGWTLAAAESVVADATVPSADVVDIVGRLVDRSLVIVEPGAPSRYRMLETLREYAAEQLPARGRHEAVARRHAAYFTDFVARADRDLRGHQQRTALARLRADQPNIRAALAWLRGPAGDTDAALTLAGGLGLFWHLGRHVEGRAVLRDLLGAPGGAPLARAHALQAVSLVERPRACLVHPSPRCAETARESLEIFERAGDASRTALSRVLLAVEGVTGAEAERSAALLAAAEEQFAREHDGWGRAVIGFVRMETALKRGDETEAVEIGRTTAAAFRQLDDPWGLSAVLYHLGWGLRQFGRYTDSARVLEEAIDVAASAGLYNTVQWAHADLGVTHVNLGDTTAARDSFDRARTTSEQVGDGAGAVLADYGYALLAQLNGDWDTARSGFTAALDGFDQLGTPVVKGLAIAGLARCDEATGDTESAERRYTDALQIGKAAGEPGLAAAALDGLARIAAARHDDMRAAELTRQADKIRARSHRPTPPYEHIQHRHPETDTAR
jgi:predicted ATPase/DNA-binding SARP family transcriptional activator